MTCNQVLQACKKAVDAQEQAIEDQKKVIEAISKQAAKDKVEKEELQKQLDSPFKNTIVVGIIGLMAGFILNSVVSK